MDDFLQQFVVETRELAEQATAEILTLERTPESRESLDGAFRAFHTLKGGAGIVDFAAMGRAVHAAEDALSEVRRGERRISAELISDCLACIDQVQAWLKEIESTGGLPATPDAAADELVQRFDAADGAISQPATSMDSDKSRQTRDALSSVALQILEEQLSVLGGSDAASIVARRESVRLVVSNVLTASGLDAVVSGPGAFVAEANDEEIRGFIRHLLTKSQPETLSRGAHQGDTVGNTLRVNSARIDGLVRLTGELMVAKNAFKHLAKQAASTANPLAIDLRDSEEHLERLVESLRHAVLKLRVLPLRMVFSRFPRVVRELAVDLGKPAQLDVAGDATEADKAIVDVLFEPLMHLVRNAMDHGIESEAERAASGKSVVATVGLSAQQLTDHVVIEISDDGRGIDPSIVRDTAIRRGIMSESDLANLSNEEVQDLIFAPGFSTKTEVTGVSGRGVGMDAVRRSIETVGGRVSISSETGRGTKVRLTLPFSVMMTRVVTVRVGGQLFGIPLSAVVETVNLLGESVQPIGEVSAFLFRGKTVPLLSLAQVLGTSPLDRPEGLALIASIAGQLIGIKIDAVADRLDVMLRPPSGLLATIPAVAGTTIMGDGSVLMVLDLHQLVG